MEASGPGTALDLALDTGLVLPRRANGREGDLAAVSRVKRRRFHHLFLVDEFRDLPPCVACMDEKRQILLVPLESAQPSSEQLADALLALASLLRGDVVAGGRQLSFEAWRTGVE